MLQEPVTGFTAALEKSVRNPTGKVTIKSHCYITSRIQNGSVLVNASNKYAQKVILPITTTTKYIDFFLERVSGVSSDIDIRILNDNSGVPNTSSIIARTALFGLDNKRPAWYRCQFQSAPTLTGNTPYWIEISCGVATSLNWYLNDNVDGLSYVLNDSSKTENAALILKMLSATDSENEFVLPSLIDLTINLTEKFENDSGGFTLSNLTGLYTEGQPMRHILSSGQEVSLSIGSGSDYLKKATLLVDAVTQIEGKVVSVSLLSKQSKVVNQDVSFKSAYIGMDFSDVVYDLIQQSGVTGGIRYLDSGVTLDSGRFLDEGAANIDKSNILFPSVGTLEGTISESIEKICQAINFIFYYDENGMPAFKPSNGSFSPVFTMDYTKHILFGDIQNSESKQDIFNRIRADNGQTSDNEPISLSDSSLIATETGTLLSSEKSKVININYTSTPLVMAYIVNNKSTLSRVISTYQSVSGMTVEISNLNYPNNSANYSFSIYGSLLGNAGSGLFIEEKANSLSIQKNGTRDLSITNNLFLNQSKVTQFCDEVTMYNSSPRDFVELGTICVPVIQNRDVVKINHPNLNDNFIFKVQAQSINYSNSPRSLSCKYSLERYPFLNGQSISTLFMRLDSGNYLDSGKFLDSDKIAYSSLYI